MRKLARLTAMVMLVSWGLAMSHCDLEQVPGFEFLSCCEHPDSAPHEDNDCQEDACAVVESGFYKIDEQQVVAPAPLLVLSYLLPAFDPVIPKNPAGFQALSSSPPELPLVWQFRFRAALPPRAPSFTA